MGKQRGPDGRHMETGVVDVNLTAGSGNGGVTFQNAFDQDPAVLVVGNNADSGTYTASQIDTSGITVAVSGSDISGDTVRVVWVAVEQR